MSEKKRFEDTILLGGDWKKTVQKRLGKLTGDVIMKMYLELDARLKVLEDEK